MILYFQHRLGGETKGLLQTGCAKNECHENAKLFTATAATHDEFT